MNTGTKIISTKINRKQLFQYWLVLSQKIHKLTPKEIELFGLILYYRYEYQKLIRDDKALDKYVLEDCMDKIAEEMKINKHNQRILMTKIRKTGVITGKQINKKYILDIKEETESFDVIFKFNIDDK